MTEFYTHESRQDRNTHNIQFRPGRSLKSKKNTFAFPGTVFPPLVYADMDSVAVSVNENGYAVRRLGGSE